MSGDRRDGSIVPPTAAGDARGLGRACSARGPYGRIREAAEEYRRLKTRAEDETEVGAAGPVV